MRLIKSLAETGLRMQDSYPEKRAVVLTNYISMTLCAAIFLIFAVRLVVFNNMTIPYQLAFGMALFAIPILLNRFSRQDFGRLFVSIVPTLYIWLVFVMEMKKMDPIPGSVYSGLRVYLLAVSCVPYLVLTRTRWQLLLAGVVPSFVSIIFFEFILRQLGVGYTVTPGSDFELMHMRFLVAYFVIGVTCYMLQSVIMKNDEINRRLIEDLKTKTQEAEAKNQELTESRNKLAEANCRLEALLVERGRKIYQQQSNIASYAYANAHYLRGPVARLMGLVELQKMDPKLDQQWLMTVIENETKDIDSIVKKISSELRNE